MLPQHTGNEFVHNDGFDGDASEAVHHMADLYLLSSEDMMLKMLNPVSDRQRMRDVYVSGMDGAELNQLDRRQMAPTTSLSYPQAIKHMLEVYASPAVSTQKQNVDQQKMSSAYLSGAAASQTAHLSRRQASLTTDPCISLIGSTFPTNSALFCSGWLAATGGYVAPAFSTACSAANVNSRLSSACSVINSPTKVVTTPAATLASGQDSCASLVTSAFPTNSMLFCNAWLQGGTTQYVAPPFQTACASNSYSRLSSVCSRIIASSGAAAPIPTVTSSATDVCVSFIKSSFPTNSAAFCSGWYNGGTTQYVAPPFQTSCSAANVYSRITSACNVILTSSGVATATTATAKAPSTPDSCAAIITSAFSTNSALFCSGFYVGGSTQFIAPAFSTACSAINISSRISSACKTALGVITASGVVTSASSTPTAAPTTISTPTGTNQCIACIASAFQTSSALFCSGWLTQGTTQYVAPPFSTSCAPGNVYSVMTSACNAILSPSSSFATASATVNPICTTTASWTPMVAKTKIVVPTPSAVALHGPSVLQSNLFVVPNQYFWSLQNPPPTLPNSVTSQYSPNTALITNYPLYLNGTGALTIQPGQTLQKLQYQPNLSRDAGKGGVLCGQKMFIFADTGISSPAIGGVPGSFQGFVSNSVATDVGLAGAQGKPLAIQDGIGEWSGTAGNMRGFIPLTQGEVSIRSRSVKHPQQLLTTTCRRLTILSTRVTASAMPSGPSRPSFPCPAPPLYYTHPLSSAMYLTLPESPHTRWSASRSQPSRHQASADPLRTALRHCSGVQTTSSGAPSVAFDHGVLQVQAVPTAPSTCSVPRPTDSYSQRWLRRTSVVSHPTPTTTVPAASHPRSPT